MKGAFMAVELTEPEHKVLSALLQASGPTSVEEIASGSGVDQAQVAAAAVALEQRGWISIGQRDRLELSASGKSQGPPFPEQAYIDAAPDAPTGMQEAAGLAAQLGVKLNEVLKWGTQRGWLRKEAGQILLTEEGRRARGSRAPDARALELVASGPRFLDELEAQLGI